MDAIRSEMHRIIQERVEAGLLTSTHQLVQRMIDARPGIQGEDAAFYRVQTFSSLSRIATKVIGKYRGKESTAQELLLPGFKHLCKAYSISRGDDIVIVPVDQCSDAELRDRASLLDEMAKGCMAHADEIREYLLARGRQAA